MPEIPSRDPSPLPPIPDAELPSAAESLAVKLDPKTAPPRGGTRHRENRERQDRTLDVRRAADILEKIEAESRLAEILRTPRTGEQNRLLLTLLLHVLRHGFTGLMRVEPKTDEEELEPTRTSSVDKTGARNEAKAQEEYRGRQRVESELAGGKSLAQIEADRHAAVAEADQVIDDPRAGRASRDTAKRRRDAAQWDLAACEKIRAQRGMAVTEYNRRYDLGRLATAKDNPLLDSFARAKFVLDQDGNIVLSGIRPIDLARQGGIELAASPDGRLAVNGNERGLVVRLAGAHRGLEFVRSDDGSQFILKDHPPLP